MSLNETRIDIPAEHVSNIFGQFDHNIKLIERTCPAMNESKSLEIPQM